MNFFLIEYDLKQHKTLRLERYKATEEASARVRRLDLELEARRGGKEVELLLLGALDEQALRKTHGRYFEDIHTLIHPQPPFYKRAS